MSNKSTRTINVQCPIKEDINVNEYARRAACCIFLENDFGNIVKMANNIDVIETILRKLNQIITNNNFVPEYIGDNLSLNKLRMYNNSARLIDEDQLDEFLAKHDYKDNGVDTYYNIQYECSNEYILIDLPKWTVLIKNILKTS